MTDEEKRAEAIALAILEFEKNNSISVELHPPGFMGVDLGGDDISVIYTTGHYKTPPYAKTQTWHHLYAVVYKDKPCEFFNLDGTPYIEEE